MRSWPIADVSDISGSISTFYKWMVMHQSRYWITDVILCLYCGTLTLSLIRDAMYITVYSVCLTK